MNENDSYNKKRYEMPRSPGRPAGSVNKATAAVREAIARMAEDNAENFVSWISQVADKSPEKACDINCETPKIRRFCKVITQYTDQIIAHKDFAHYACVFKILLKVS